jgi:hypothetical protein
MSVRRPWIGIGCLFAAALAAAAALYPRRPLLHIVDLTTRRVALCATMAEGEEFGISFIHSVNKRPVHDTLRVAGDHLVIVRSRFDALGAGMPDATTDAGVLRQAPDGWLEWTVNRPMPEVVLRVGRVADHRLRLKGREIPLVDLAAPGVPLAFRAAIASPWEVWKERCLR